MRSRSDPQMRFALAKVGMEELVSSTGEFFGLL